MLFTTGVKFGIFAVGSVMAAWQLTTEEKAVMEVLTEYLSVLSKGFGCWYFIEFAGDIKLLRDDDEPISFITDLMALYNGAKELTTQVSNNLSFKQA